MTDTHPRTIRTQKKSTLVAESIVASIVDEDLSVGDRLPAEAEMCAHYGVGKATMREALRLLESQGVIRIKTGPGGGPVVAGFDAEFLASTLTLHLHISGATFRDVMCARLEIEPAIAGAAAERSDPRTVELLEQLIKDAENPATDSPAVATTGASFHDIIAAGAGNPVFEGLLRSMRCVTEPFARRLPFEGVRRQNLVDHHAAIVRSIAAGDRVAAAAAMRVDILEFIDFVEDVAPELFDEPVQWTNV